MKAFLEMNGDKMRVTDEKAVSRFTKKILSYNIEETTSWLEHGPKKDHPVKIPESVLERRNECLDRLDGGTKKTQIK
ncbi:MAG: hypothetical protein WCC63_07130 [Candidatus Bathyarchaeia archaeon]